MHFSLTTFGNPKPFRTNFPKPVWDLHTFPGGRNPSSVFLLKVLSLWVWGSCPHPLQGLEGEAWVSLTRACAAHGDTDSGLHKHNRLKLPNHHTGLKHSPRSRLMTELPGAQTLNQRLARKHNVTSQPISTGWCYSSFETLSPWTTWLSFLSVFLPLLGRGKANIPFVVHGPRLPRSETPSGRPPSSYLQFSSTFDLEICICRLIY